MESISVFEIIKIGIGPSSSHTMGPWLASELFIEKLRKQQFFYETVAIAIHLYGSLAKTGKGHGSDLAILLGLSGYNYQTIDPTIIPNKFLEIKGSKKLFLGGTKELFFDYHQHLTFHYQTTLSFHANGLSFIATLANGKQIAETYYSLGGGFVATENINTIIQDATNIPYPYRNAADLLTHCDQQQTNLANLIYQNEQSWRSPAEIDQKALELWEEIKSCIFRGVHKSGTLPGGLNVKRRAAEINQKLLANQRYQSCPEWLIAITQGDQSFNTINKWVSCFALAVNEENAAFGRVVTAPTNGAAGVIPAVLLYAFCFTPQLDQRKIINFLLTAGQIGILFKMNATISAAMGGCQAEIGVSSAMAAAGLTEVLGGSPGQVLMAAEIAMEHHLGLTCDPVAGLVQIPCIERNSMGAIKAITASNIALESDPSSAKVSLDDVIKTMWETAKDMSNRYKETSEGGLATNLSVNISEC